MLNNEQRKKLLGIARNSIEGNKVSGIDDFMEKRGVFVTLMTPDGNLRGCIGFPEPIYTLGEGVKIAARLAAYEDYRFEPLGGYEKFFLEISVLTKPELVRVGKAEGYMEKIKVGRDGLIIKGKGASGLLLPQVAVEEKWNVKEFLENTCIKAGLGKNEWKDLKNQVFRFEGEVFSEKEFRKL